ncbi:MAG: hypothetical protein ACFB4I_24470 [Cyanophyceae cyanobacterium]
MNAQQQRHKAESRLLVLLQQYGTPLSLQELEKLCLEESLPSRATKEAAWKLVEEGKIQFTPAWELEVRA